MKKIFGMIVAAMIVATSVNAQNDEEYLKHEIGISYGMLSNSAWMSIGESLGTTIVSFGSVRYDNSSSFGPLAMEYFYHLNPVVGIGAIGAYVCETKDMFLGNNHCGEAKNSYVTVLPAVKFNWLRKPHFGLYSKVAAGATFRSQKEDFTSEQNEDNSKTSVLFNFQLTGIGIEAGSKNVRGFAEFGVGEQGLALAGIRFKF
jgi:hypothetical protein